MNHIYRLVWNRAKRVMQVVSEVVAGGGGGGVVAARASRRNPLALACALALGSGGMLAAMPAIAADIVFPATTLNADDSFSTADNIRQTGAFVNPFATTLVAGGNITLTNAGNDFGVLSLQGLDVEIVDLNDLTLGTFEAHRLIVTTNGALNLGRGISRGTLRATTNNGAISQTGPVEIYLPTHLDAGTGDIVLGNAGNHFRAAVHLVGGNVRIAAGTSGLTLGTINVGNLTATTQGWVRLGDSMASSLIADNLTATGLGISQTGPLRVGGTTDLDADTSIDLTHVANDFVGRVSLSGTSVKIQDANDLALGVLATDTLVVTSNGALDLGSGSSTFLTATSNGGDISQDGALVVRDLTLDAGTGDILLEDAGNAIAGIWATGHNIVIHGSTNLNMYVLDNGVNGAVELTAAGSVNLTSSPIDTGTANLTLESRGGSLRTPGALTGHDVTLFGQAVTLNNTTTATGNLSVTSVNGTITSANAVTVDGASSFDAGIYAITLDNAANDFTGSVSLSGGTTVLRDANALTFGALDTGHLTVVSHGALDLGIGNVDGNLSATSNGGAITQSGALSVTGRSTIDAGTGGITLANAGNDFTGAVSLTGGHAQIMDANVLTLGTFATGNLTVVSHGALDLGAGDVGGNLSATSNGGAITQSGALSVTGSSTIDAGTGAITLTNAGNDFSGSVALAAGAVSINDANALELGTLSTGALSATSHGALSLGSGSIGGDLAATSNGGAITQSGALTVTGNSTIDSGPGLIFLNNGGNDFTGAVSLTGGHAQIMDANALTLGTLATGDMTVISIGALDLGAGDIAGYLFATSLGDAITQSGALTIDGYATISALGDLILTNAGNDFSGRVVLGGHNISMRDANDLEVRSLINGLNGAVDLAAGGTLTLEPGAIDTGTASLVLGSGAAFATSGALNGDDVTVHANGLTLGHDLTAASTLSLSGGTGSITQVGGAINAQTLVSGPATTGDVTLTAAGNDIYSLGDFSAGNLSLASSGLLIEGDVSIGGDLLLDAGPAGILVLGSIDADRTVLAAGTSMRIGDGGIEGSLSGDIRFDDFLIFDRDDNVTYTGLIDGTGTLSKDGFGMLTLDGDSAGFAGTTRVDDGELIVGSVAGNGASLSGDVFVASGSALLGHGTLRDNVVIESGGILAPGTSFGTLTVGGNLQLDQGSQLFFEFGAPGADSTTPGISDRVDVAGDLSIDGATLDVVDRAGFAAGLYTVLTWGGTLTRSNGGLTLGYTPGGLPVRLQVLHDRINVLSTPVPATGGGSSLELNFWNANGAATSSQLGGGSGTWSAASSNWTDADATLTAAMQPQPGFAIFGGASGTVDIDDGDGAVEASGMQFASDGYAMTGDTLTLVGNGSEAPVIRVGDGSAAGAAMSATIGNTLAGSDGLVKADAGTLVLSGDNTYTGGTTVAAGTLRVSTDANLGAAGEGIVLDGGTLAGTGSFTTVRDIALGEAGGRLLADTAFAVDGAISGAGTLHTSGLVTLTNGGNSLAALSVDDGTLALAGAGVAPGAVALAAGTIFDISQTNAGATVSGLAGSGHVALGSHALTFAGGTSVFGGTFGDGGIGGGTGGSLLLASGTLTLTSANLLLNDVHVDAGARFALGGAGGAGGNATIGGLGGSGDVDLGGSTLTITGGKGGTGSTGSIFNGSMGGKGGNLHIGGGSMVLGGVNTYTGTTTIAGGASLILSGAGSIASSSGVVVDGIFDIGGTSGGATVGGLSGSGDVVLGDRGLAIVGGNSSFAGNFSGSGALHLQEGSRLDLVGAGGSGGSGGSATFHVQLVGEGTLGKGGNGTLILGNGGAGFAGQTQVDSGSLIIGGAPAGSGGSSAMLGGNVAVAQGAILGGHGGVGGNVSNAGTMAPGNSIGTFTIDGDYVQTATGTLEIEARADGQADKLVVGGSATLDGSMLVLAADGDWRPQTDYTILTAAGGISGQFGTATSSLLFLDPLVGYGVDAVTLTLRRNNVAFASAAASSNQTGVAAAADALGWGNPVYAGLTTLDGAQAAAAFDALSGEIHASTRGVLLEDSRHLEQAVVLQLASIPAGADAGAWVATWGNWGRFDGDGNAADVESDGSGVVIGADLPVGDSVRVGAMLASSRLSVDSDVRASRSDINGRHVGVYARFDAQVASFQAGVLRGSHEIDTRRSVAFAGYQEALQADVDADTTQYFLDASRVFDLGSMQLIPYANIARVEVRSDAAEESGGDAALHVEAGDVARTMASAGLHAEWRAGDSTDVWTSVGWMHASGDDRAMAQQRFVSGAGTTPFAVGGTELANSSALLDVGLRWQPGARTTLEAAYNGRFGDGLRDQGARVSLRVAF